MMKTFVFFVMLTATLWGDTPGWYETRHYQNGGKTYYGYGQGPHKEAALTAAKAEIASALHTTVTSAFTSRQERTGENNARLDLKATTQATLTGVKIVKEAVIDGVWYLVAHYVDQSLLEHLVDYNATLKTSCTNIQNIYLAQTPLFMTINQKLGCKHPLRLQRRDGAWYVVWNDFAHMLSVQEFDALFKKVDSTAGTLIVSQTQLYDEDPFSFTLLSNQKGYVSLLTVYEDGKTGVLLANAPIVPNIAVLFPKADEPVEMVAGLVKADTPTKDLHVLLFTPQAIDLTRFEAVSDAYITAESEYRFAELIELMARYPFATVLQRTLPKKGFF